MQTSSACRVFVALLLAALASCSRTSGNPYAAIKDPPIVQARLHTVTLATDSSTVAQELQAKGYAPIQFASNYPVSVPVEASLWSVPQPVAASATHFKSPGAGEANLRVLQMALAAGSRSADSAVDKAFFSNVLGAGVPVWPAAVERTQQGSRPGLDLPDPRHPGG